MDLNPIARMGALWILIAACCGFALWAPPALWNQFASAQPSTAGDAAEVWWEEAWPSLLEREPAWMLAERGAELTAVDDAFLNHAGYVMIERALELAGDDAHALLRIASACGNELLASCSFSLTICLA